MCPVRVKSRSRSLAPVTRHAPGAICEGDTDAPADRIAPMISVASPRWFTTRNATGAASLLARAKAVASSMPNALVQRSINHDGCEVSTAILSIGSAMPVTGSYSGSRAARLKTAFTSDSAERSLARRVVRRDLVRNVSSSARYLASLQHARTYTCRPVCLHLRTHERALPLAVAVQLVEVGEHLLGRAIDLDAVLDHGTSSRRER